VTPVSHKTTESWQRNALSPHQFQRAVEEERLRSERSGGVFALVMLDWEDDATVNGNGVDVLDAVTQTALRRVRRTDRVGRLSRRLAVLLPDTSETGARLLAEDLERDWHDHYGARPRVTIDSFPASGDDRNGYAWEHRGTPPLNGMDSDGEPSVTPQLEPHTREAGPLGAKAPIPLWKRMLDLVGSTVLLAAFSPLMLLVGLYIWIADGRSILYRQERVGFGGRSFTMFKFRTMKKGKNEHRHREHAENFIKGNGVMTKVDGDLKLIPGAALLRRSGIDELPQLINVLRGEMSLVGPRPCIPYEARAYCLWHLRRLDVLPGMTGLWQVSGRNRLAFDEMVRLDVRYANQPSLWKDLVLLLRTPITMIRELADSASLRTDLNSE
jgi:lipopolysaccharide/colanic/teichoic acid biosynthesis glycosyltransferase